MFRVVTQYRNGSTHPVVERGPWHTSREMAENWADIMREHGYVAHVETQNGMIDAGALTNDNSDLMDALASMA
ncbi:hypothetical protein [Azonexus sp.]|uniref:hypothetical protein n=1 Tax=Azonexus sp. TaxID=1872668 RepID=UPI0027BA4D76|nr:hypothetical protein [Azonexus sp.]